MSPANRIGPGAEHSRRGRPPTLAARGRWVGAGALVLALVGFAADRPDLVALGLGLAALLFVVLIGQFPAAVFIWRRHVELAWRVERPSGDGTLYPGRALSLFIELRNRAPRALGAAVLRPITSSGLEVESIRLDARARSDLRIAVQLAVRSVGPALLHGAALELADPLGLTRIEAYFPSPIALSIVPRLGGPLGPTVAPRAFGPERPQRAAARLAGQGGELRELRDHRPGDPWKQIAWKATARRGRLTVREVERETQTAHLVVLDASASSREGRPGRTPFDVAVELAARYARTALDAGDQLGLAVVDGRVTATVPISDRPGQRRFVTEALSAAVSYDEDTTDLSDADLCATVGRYLLMQEGEDTRIAAPRIDDPAWTRLIAAPSGELYELDRLVRSVRAVRERSRLHVAHGARLPKAGDPHMAELRAFCRERAIVLPGRVQSGRGLKGVLAALSVLRMGRAPDRILVLSPFDGLGDLAVEPELLRMLEETLARLRRRGSRMVFVAPLAPTAAAKVDDPLGQLLEVTRQRRERELMAWARRLGVVMRTCNDATTFRWPSIERRVRSAA